MLGQIEEDLSPFYESGVTQEMLDMTMEGTRDIPTSGTAMLMRYKIKDNKISYTTHYHNLDDRRINGFIYFLEEMAKIIKIPDVEFIMSLADFYDRPIYFDGTYSPVFTICKLKGNKKGVLLPEVRSFQSREECYYQVNAGCAMIPWESKNSKAFWCGRTTGRYYAYYEWDMQPRPRLIFFSMEHPDLLEAQFTHSRRLTPSLKPYFEEQKLFHNFTSPVDSMRYKYQIAVDGVSFPSSYWWQLLSNCTVIKGESDFIEWFYKGAEPYVHYIPYEQDCSDLQEKIEWLMTHDEEAKKIAENGRRFALEHLGYEGILLYYYTLFTQYAQLQRF